MLSTALWGRMVAYKNAKENKMNILYCGDGNIADGVIMSTLSIAKTVHEPLDFYILTASAEYRNEMKKALPQKFAPFLENALKEYCDSVSVTLIDITDKFQKELPDVNMNTRFTPFCMLRLFADEVEELPPKILYLDNDVICRTDPCLFYHTKMDDIDMCGVLDYYGSWFFRQKWYKRDYLNSGVLLLNLEGIRADGLFKKARKMCAEKKMFMPDQSALNKLCKNKIIAKRKFNEQRKLRDDTVFQHFTTSFRFFPYFHSVSVKPWNEEGMHETLKLHEYDAIIEEYKQLKSKYSEIQGEPTK